MDGNITVSPYRRMEYYSIVETDCVLYPRILRYKFPSSFPYAWLKPLWYSICQGFRSNTCSNLFLFQLNIYLIPTFVILETIRSVRNCFSVKIIQMQFWGTMWSETLLIRTFPFKEYSWHLMNVIVKCVGVNVDRAAKPAAVSKINKTWSASQKTIFPIVLRLKSLGFLVSSKSNKM